MPITYINTGTSPNAGNGDVLRLAFQKVNANFGYLNTLTTNLITDQELFTTSSVTFNDITAGVVTATNFIASRFYAPFGGPNVGGYAFEGTGNDTGLFGPSDDVVDIVARNQTVVRFVTDGFVSSVVSYGTITPSDTLSYSLGNSGRYWLESYIDTAIVTRIQFPDGSILTSATGTSTILSNVNQSIIPSTNLAYDLGSTSSQWRSLYVGTSTIYIGGTALSVENGSLTLGGSPVSVNSLTNDTAYFKLNSNGTAELSSGFSVQKDAYNDTLLYDTVPDSGLGVMSQGVTNYSWSGLVWNQVPTDVYVGTSTSVWMWVEPSGAHIGYYDWNEQSELIDSKVWHFDTTGYMIFPDGTIQQSGIDRDLLGPLGKYPPLISQTARNLNLLDKSNTFTGSLAQMEGVEPGWYAFGFGMFNSIVQTVTTDTNYLYLTVNDGEFLPFQDYTFSVNSGTVTAIPANSQGCLYNDGTGTLTWSVLGGGISTTSTLINGTYTVALSTSGSLVLPTVLAGDTAIGTAFNSNPPGHTLTLKHNNGVADGSGGELKFDYGTAEIKVVKDAGTTQIWTFDTAGLLTLPGGDTIIGSLYGNDAILASTGTTFGIVSQGAGASIIQWIDDVNNANTIAGIAINSMYSSTGSVQIYTGSVGPTPQNAWTFSNTGTLSIPGPVVFSDSTTQYTAYNIINNIPLSSTSTGIRGQIATTGTDIYICVGTNSWLRVTGVTF